MLDPEQVCKCGYPQQRESECDHHVLVDANACKNCGMTIEEIRGRREYYQLDRHNSEGKRVRPVIIQYICTCNGSGKSLRARLIDKE